MNSDREVYIAPEDEIPAEDRERLLQAMQDDHEATLGKMEAEVAARLRELEALAERAREATE